MHPFSRATIPPSPLRRRYSSPLVALARTTDAIERKEEEGTRGRERERGERMRTEKSIERIKRRRRLKLILLAPCQRSDPISRKTGRFERVP